MSHQTGVGFLVLGILLLDVESWFVFQGAQMFVAKHSFKIDSLKIQGC